MTSEKPINKKEKELKKYRRLDRENKRDLQFFHDMFEKLKEENKYLQDEFKSLTASLPYHYYKLTYLYTVKELDEDTYVNPEEDTYVDVKAGLTLKHAIFRLQSNFNPGHGFRLINAVKLDN